MQRLKRFGQIDVLINNAGFGLMGAVEEVSDAETRKLFETNVFGVLNVTRAILPHMRERRSGHIVNISSMGGFVSFAGPAVYCGTKFAVEGISEGLAQEVAPLGIKVTIVEPGAFRTDFATRSLAVAETHIPGYDATSGKFTKLNGAKFPGDPDKAAQAMLSAIDSKNPPLRLALGADSLQAIRTKLKSVEAEASAWERITVATDFDDASPVPTN